MKVYDISMAVSPDIMTYKNSLDNKPIFENQSNFSNASHYETKVTYNLHTSSHVDAPLNMIEGGNTMDAYAIERFVTACRVLDLTEVTGMIHKEDLMPFGIREGEFILFKTKNSWDKGFNFDFVFLAEDCAAYLKDLAINGVGTDSLGIERSQPDHMTHKHLLGAGIIILEGLQLAEVPAGAYQLIALPIKLEKVEAAPVRAILLEN